jgi:hypothetical protein
MAGSARPSARPARTPPSSTTTIVGEISFDDGGDTSQKIVSIYSFDPPAPTARATGSSRRRSTTRK